MRLLSLWTLVEFSVFLRRDRIGSAFGADYLALTGFLIVLVMASEAGAGALFSLPTSFAAGDELRSVAVADLDGDGVPDLVTANGPPTSSAP
jgi:hypothetical protein